MVVVRNNPKPVVFALKYSANDSQNLGRLAFHSVYLLVVFKRSSCLLESSALPRLLMSSNIAILRHAAGLVLRLFSGFGKALRTLNFLCQNV